ncbi:MAG: inorganic phosphate transporter, partial [Acetobacter orientalis]
KDTALYQPPQGEHPPRGWVRWLLVGTCSGVSFSHGSNDGQKSIGLIMLAVVGLWPALYALNPQQPNPVPLAPAQAVQLEQVLEQYDHDAFRTQALAAAARLHTQAGAAQGQGVAPIPVTEIRADIFQVVAGLKGVQENPALPSAAKASAKQLRATLRPAVEFAPWWVRLLSAVCLSLGTMIGYQRIVKTLGEKIGRTHLTPAQGASAELVGAGLILTAGYTGLPVSTTHIVTAGIAGSMLGSGAGVQRGMAGRIILAWLATLPVTILLAAALFYGLSH